ncbi:MAG: hypothetical protein KAS11_01780 [Candidatus Aenigmarchaeota archaeon]|nr:hypothetical protein [Candidatus Aenigmarchaeota archaeon]
MKPEIQKLKTEFMHQQAEAEKHYKKMREIVNKAVNMFKEDKNITFEDFKGARVLMDWESGFELAARQRLDMPNIKELIIENMLENFNKGHRIFFLPIQNYFEYEDDPGSVDNITFFEQELDEIIEYRLKDVIDFMKNHLGEDPKKHFKDFYGKDKKN